APVLFVNHGAGDRPRGWSSTLLTVAVLGLVAALAVLVPLHRSPPERLAAAHPAPAPTTMSSPDCSQHWRSTMEGISPSGDDPFVNGQAMTLAEAQRAVGFDIPRPDASLASDGQIARVWVAMGPNPS